jgi:DNA processing protein
VTTVRLTPEDLPERARVLGRPQLYLRGAAPPTSGTAIAIVGARAASATGMGRAHDLAAHFARRGVHVVSGGALGIDGAAHRGALAGGGTTTVVLGNGLDIAYPSRHAGLFAEVVARGGGLVGLLPDGVEPRPYLFPQRNPLIAALADAVIVVEAAVRSGSLSTAAAAVRFGRVVAAWPGSRGCDQLLGRGAALVESAADVERALAGEPRSLPPVVLDPDAERVRAAVAAGACGIDQIVHATGLPVRAVLRALPAVEVVLRGSK